MKTTKNGKIPRTTVPIVTRGNALDTIKAETVQEIPTVAPDPTIVLNVTIIRKTAKTTLPGGATHVENQDMAIMTGVFATATPMVPTTVATGQTTEMVMVMDLTVAIPTIPATMAIETLTIGTTIIVTTTRTTTINRHRNSITPPTCQIPTPLSVLIVIIRHNRPDGFRQRTVRENPTTSIYLVSTNRTAAQVALGMSMDGSAMIAIIEMRRSLPHEVRMHVT